MANTQTTSGLLNVAAPVNGASAASPLRTPLGTATTFDSNTYQTKQYSYPSDLFDSTGQYGGNYAIFYINVSADSKLYKADPTRALTDMPKRDQGDLVGQNIDLKTANGVSGAVEGAVGGGLLTGNLKGAAGGAVAGGAAGVATGALLSSMGTTRANKRLKTAIALHIPNDLSISYGVQWSEEDTAALAMGGAAGEEVIKAITSGGKNSDVTGVGADILANLALSKAPNAGANSAAIGLAANPKKEQVFKGVDFRTFSFDYKFFPRNSTEAQYVLNIIQEFKYHMHPEFKDSNNFLYIYPSEFDIMYYQNGQENLNLHRHTSAVLTHMSINYTPNGMFTTFADGMPTQIDVKLDFRELALLTKDKVKAGL
jgi:uncharacterized protein YcfJ